MQPLVFIKLEAVRVAVAAASTLPPLFITEETFGRPFLNAPMPEAYIEYLAKHGLKVRVEYVRHS